MTGSATCLTAAASSPAWRAGRQLRASVRASAQEAAVPAARRQPKPKLPGSLADEAAPRRLDPHRCARRGHRLHRQGRARPGHQDGAPPGRGGGAGGRARRHQAGHRRYRPARRTRAIPPAASRCRTAAPRSAMRRRRCARSWSAGGSARRRARGRPAGRERQRWSGRTARRSAMASLCPARSSTSKRSRNRTLKPPDRFASWASRCPASTFPPRSRATPPTCTTCARRAWCMRAWSVRRATARRSVSRYGRRRADAGRRLGGAQWQFSGRGGRTGIPGGPGDAGLAAAGPGQADATLPDRHDFTQSLKSLPAQEGVVAERGQAALARPQPSRRPSRAPIRSMARSAPPARVALLENGSADRLDHTQGVFPDRAAIAEMLGLPPEQVRVDPCGRLGLLRP